MARFVCFSLFAIAAVAGSMLLGIAHSKPSPTQLAQKGGNTVASVLSTLGADVRKRLAVHFEAAGVSYPPEQITFLEGIYTISGLNPNSSFHLSLKLNYPNQFDLKHAQAEGRSSLGTDIFIHGNAVSIGCLAMGDLVIEELFVLAADVKRQNIHIVIAPTDPRLNPLSSTHRLPWVPELYAEINTMFKAYVR